MIGKISTNNPVLRQDIDGQYELTFPIESKSAFAVRQLISRLKDNTHVLQVSVDLEKRQRTLSQNDLLWGLLTEYARVLNGGRKNPDLTAEKLYLKAVNDYGKDTIVCVVEGAEQALKRVYKRVFIIDKFEQDGKMWSKCRCVLGSSTYDTKEMSDLIEGVLDEMSQNGITSDKIIYLRGEYGK